MASTLRWISGAAAVAQVQDYLFGGTWENNDVVLATIGNVQVSLGATGSTVITTLLDTFVTAFNALDADLYPQCAEMTASRSGNYFRLTADTEGVPFALTLSTTETGGGAADAQTIDGAASSAGTATTASAGPNDWGTAANWDINTLPADTDTVVIENSDQDILYGLSQTSIDLAVCTINPSYTGNIGLPKRNANGYAEYRTDYLKLGTATTLTVKGGKRVKINVGANACSCVVNGTGTSPEQGVPAFLFLGTSASNTMTVLKGSVGVAFYAGETSDLTGGLRLGSISNKESDANVYCGSGVTLVTVTKDGGVLETNSNVTTLINNAGETKHMAGTMTNLTGTGGIVRYNSTGALGTPILSGNCLLDFDQDPRAKTVTNPIDVYGDKAKPRDTYKVVATFVVDYNYAEVKINGESVGTNVRFTRGTPA
jgi:hypothetical protein